MRQVNKIDILTGMYTEPVILQDDEECPSDCIEKPCPDGFYWPKWDGAQWVEGKTAEEIAAIKADTTSEPTLEDRVASAEAAITALMGV